VKESGTKSASAGLYTRSVVVELYDVRGRFIDASLVASPTVSAAGADPGEKGVRNDEDGALRASTL